MEGVVTRQGTAQARASRFLFFFSLNVLIAPHYDYAGLANQHATLGGAAKVRRNTHTVRSR